MGPEGLATVVATTRRIDLDQDSLRYGATSP
jgi:hypothetical protein